MTNETKKALDFIHMVTDRAIQRGNIFSGLSEVVAFINAFNHISDICDEKQETNHQPVQSGKTEQVKNY